MEGILQGVKVIEAGNIEAAPNASAMMGDWGADVIKVEPLFGEIHRGTKRIMGVAVGNTLPQQFNRNKRGLAVDLKKEPGRDIFYQLIKRSDVFVSNYTLEALDRLKLDYATLSQLNPGLIYATVSGYGRVGPDKDEPGYDITAGWARSGIQYLFGAPGSPPPMGRPGMVDKVVAGYAVAGICAALFHRERTGRGQELELSLYHTGVWISGNSGGLEGMPPHDRTKAGNPIWNQYRTKDDRWLQLGMLQSNRHWPDFCRAIERPDLEKDPRFNDMETRTQNCEELIRIIDEVFATKTKDEWEKRFRENNCIYGRVATPLEVATDPQALANDFFVEMEHPVGKVKLTNMPVKFLQNPVSVRTLAPELGQHTEEILLELGYGWEDIARLKEQGVIL